MFVTDIAWCYYTWCHGHDDVISLLYNDAWTMSSAYYMTMLSISTIL